MKVIMAMLGQLLRERLVISVFISVVLIMGGACVWWLEWGWYDQQRKTQPGQASKSGGSLCRRSVP